MANLPDEAQLEALHSRDRGAVAAVIETHSKALYAAALGLGLQEDDAAELVQETFAAFLEHPDRFEGRSSVRTYLFGILYNKAKQRWRDHWREQATDPVDEVFDRRFDAEGVLRVLPPGPEEEALTKETAVLIEECAAGLSQAQRAAFYLKEVEGETTEALCNILDVSVTNLGVLLFRARNKLRECLEKKWSSDR